MGGCCRWGWLVRQGDTPDEARIKTTGFPSAMFIFLVNIFLLVQQRQANNVMMAVLGSAISAGACILFIGNVVSNAIPAGKVLDVVLMLCTFGLCAMDLGNATRS
eukprot:Hpha_TRINITY_DN15590_c3_g1::TRINITY_DN15590_c3_g1_i9::g.106325::m.106325